MNLIKKLKKTAVVTAGSAILGGVLLSGNAQAITINNGDLVLALFGNNNEYFLDLGAESTLMASGTSTSFAIPWGSDTNSLMSALENCGTGCSTPNPLQWEIFGYTGTSSTSTSYLYAGSTSNATDTHNAGLVGVQSAYNATSSWGPQITQLSTGGSYPSATGANDTLVPSTDPYSFSSTFGTDGTLKGSFPVAMQGGIGDMLYMLKGQDRLSTLTDIGTASLVLGSSLDLTVCGVGSTACSVAPPIPIPASVVLFATGLIGLVGMARRGKMIWS
ncbi:MAG TPA: VPLPA-CTERM sorting domain-containing protein [Nitrospiria bacterium]|nr:VPLPA-CTERM sorting domain-containing protein [Nitrospiria bacterium]